MPLAEPSKNVWLTIAELDAWATFLRTRGYQLPKNPKPSEIIRGLWQYLNMLAQSPPSPVVIQQSIPSSARPLQVQEIMPKQPETINSRYGPVAWMALYDPDSGESNKTIKAQVIKYWGEANDLSPEDLDRSIHAGATNCYDAAAAMVKYLREEAKLSFMSTHIYRKRLKSFYRFAKYPDFREELFEQYVQKIRNVTQTNKRRLSVEEVGRIIQNCDPVIQPYAFFLASTGWRVAEPRNLLVKDFHWEPIPMVTMNAVSEKGELTNKTSKNRESILSEEAVQYFRDQFKDKKPNDPAFNTVLTKNMVADRIMDGIQKAGLQERAGALNRNTVHPHTFRVFLSELMTDQGFPDAHVDLQVGHQTSMQGSHYTTIQSRYEMWVKQGFDETLRLLVAPVAAVPQVAEPLSVSKLPPLATVDPVPIPKPDSPKPLAEPTYPLKPPPPVDSPPIPRMTLAEVIVNPKQAEPIQQKSTPSDMVYCGDCNHIHPAGPCTRTEKPSNLADWMS